VKGEHAQAVDSALRCLGLFGIDIPAHPTWEQVQAGYETVWRNLDGRPIEGLIDLPLMTDPELQAAMRVLLCPAKRCLLYRFICFACSCVPWSTSACSTDERRIANACGYLGLSSARCFTVTAKVIVSPASMRPGGSTSSSQPAKVYTRWDWLPSGRSRSRARSISIGRPSHCDRDG